MDYIKTLLRRQQAVLHALMQGGGAAAEERRPPDPDGETAAGHQGRQPAGDGTALRRRYPSGIPEKTFAGIRRQSTGSEFLEKPSAAPAEKKQEEQPAKRGTSARESGISQRKSGAAAPAAEGEAPWNPLSGAAGWMMPSFPAEEERAGGNAQRLSRAIQLDARRYDGGFVMY